MGTPSGDGTLTHYGVKGMRWGVRRNADGTTSRTGKRVKSSDREEADTIRKKKPYEMTNAELKKVNERLQLEQTYAQLLSKEGTKISKGNKTAKELLSVAKTGQEVYNLYNSPAGKLARDMVEQALKR